MNFVKIEIDDEEIILNMEYISILEKKEKFVLTCSNYAPYPLESTPKEGEFEYFVWLKCPYRGAYGFNVNKDNFELIKSKMGV